MEVRSAPWLIALLKPEQLRVRQTQRYLAAFKPLYASLDDDQARIADRMLPRLD